MKLQLNPKLKEKIHESLAAVLPVSVIVLVISMELVAMDLGALALFLSGALMLIVGMGLFQMGAEMAMSPIGEDVGSILGRSRRRGFVIGAGILIGTMITVAEPDLAVLARQVPAIDDWLLIWTIALGVGLFLTAAILRILLKWDLGRILCVLYLLVFLLSLLVPDVFRALAFDSGGVTTGPVTVPFIMALGVGLAASRPKGSAENDSFGLIAMSSVGPILAVMVLGMFFHPENAAYAAFGLQEVKTTRDVYLVFLHETPTYLKEVLMSMVPVLIIFVVTQFMGAKKSRISRQKTLIGFVYTYLGLVLFLCGVNVGFSPVGYLLGREFVAGSAPWLLVPTAMLIGYYIVKAEPAIAVLNRQIASITDGMVSQKAMNRALSIGVCLAAGLSVVRVLTGLHIYWLLVPGYALALGLSLVVPKMFVGIAFDSGGVASGPMTTTFLLPLCIGACEAGNGNVMTDAFGVVALVALTPLLAIQLMGLKYRIDMKRARTPMGTLPEDADEIVDLEEAVYE